MWNCIIHNLPVDPGSGKCETCRKILQRGQSTPELVRELLAAVKLFLDSEPVEDCFYSGACFYTDVNQQGLEAIEDLERVYKRLALGE